MTIICAMIVKNGIYIGNNSGVLRGGNLYAHSLKPWIHFGKWSFGITGESQAQKYLEQNLGKLKNSKLDETKIMSLVEEIFIENSFGKKDEDGYSNIYGIFGILVNIDGKIFDVSETLVLTEPIDRFCAQGSGADFAMGSNFALKAISSELSPTEYLGTCLRSAIDQDINCPGIPVIEELKLR